MRTLVRLSLLFAAGLCLSGCTPNRQRAELTPQEKSVKNILVAGTTIISTITIDGCDYIVASRHATNGGGGIAIIPKINSCKYEVSQAGEPER